MAKGYHVTWEIDIDSAESPRDAAEQAWAHMRRDDSIANVFDVIEHDGSEIVRVDLSDADESIDGAHFDDNDGLVDNGRYF